MIPLSSPIIWNSLHFVAISLKISISFFISLTKSLYISNNITHILQHTIIHYTLSIFLSSLIFRNFIILLPKDTSPSHSLFHIQNPPFLESNITHGITQKTTSAATIISSIYYILLSYHLSYTYIHITNTISHNI